ncbi:YdeI/OmpD-associated family protein [Bacillus sp. FSL K6-6540]|uniref:YdeI/OmpD-associated family protein n=1 Tax=Bacillus sp. FSL K6-6540 TaxID=2921512 RepID=UPI004046946F
MIVCPTANQRRLALSIEGAKTMETHQRRIDKTITMLNEGRAQKDGEFLPVKSKNPVLPWQYRVLFMAVILTEPAWTMLRIAADAEQSWFECS